MYRMWLHNDTETRAHEDADEGYEYEVVSAAEYDRLKDAVRKAVDKFNDIYWGYEGDCGSQDIINELENEINRG